MDLGAAVVADEQSFEVVEPGEGAFDDPAVAAEAGAVLGLAAGDLGLDPALTELAAVLVVVVASIGSDAFGATAWPADLAAHRRHLSSSGINWVTSLRLPPVTLQASGRPVPSTRRWCLEPFLALSTGLGPVSEPPFSPERGSRPRPLAPTRSHRQRVTPQAAARATSPTRPAFCHSSIRR